MGFWGEGEGVLGMPIPGGVERRDRPEIRAETSAVPSALVERAAPSTTTPGPSLIDRLVSRTILGLLVAYTLALIVPEPGRWLRAVDLATWSRVELSLTPVTLLLSLMLFRAGLSLNIRRLIQPDVRPDLGLVGASLGLRAGLALALALLAWHAQGSTREVLAGLVVVYCLPAANSAIVWVQQVQGRISQALAILLLGTLISPWVAPWLLETAGTLVGAADLSKAWSLLAQTYDGGFVTVWVILPIALGMGLGQLLGPERIHAWRPGLRLSGWISLLMLNYINASVGLPMLWGRAEPGILLLIPPLVVSVCASTLGLSLLTSRVLSAPRDAGHGMAYLTTMSNTGLALVLVTEALPDRPLLQAAVLTATLSQHVVVSLHAARVSTTIDAHAA